MHKVKRKKVVCRHVVLYSEISSTGQNSAPIDAKAHHNQLKIRIIIIKDS